MTGTKVSGVIGEIDEVYTTPDGFITVESVVPNDLVDNGTPELTTGWLQVSANERIGVMRRRISHSMCVWKPI